MKYSMSHVGKTYLTKDGYFATVIDGGSKQGTCLISFNGNDDMILEVYVSNLKKGSVKNPNHRSVLGVGYFGVGKYKSSENGKHTKAYSAWMSMMKRCYSYKSIIRNPTYSDVKVCEEWHNFQNFAKWFYDNYVDGYELDKDLLSGESKIYSPETCIFIPHQLNSFLTTNIQSSNTSGNSGVYWDKNCKRWRSSISIDGTKYERLGSFKEKGDAIKAYNEKRKQMANIWKERMAGILPEDVVKKYKIIKRLFYI